MYKYILIFLVAFLSIGCNNNNEKSTQNVKSKVAITDDITAVEKAHPGKKAMQANCYSCHNPQAPEGARLAPLFSEIKQAYGASSTDEKTYIKAMMDWIKNPKESSSRMPKMIKKYGLMPKMSFSKEDEKLIAEYIYNYDVKVEIQEELLDGEFDYKKQGMKSAMMTKKQLGKNLMGQINKNGTAAALRFCNARAMPIIDSMSTVLDVKISRVSDKPRNLINQANKIELAYLEKYHSQNNQGLELNPTMVHKDKTHTYYAPILTNPMCIQCHGMKGSDIKPAVQSLIDQYYPQDKATSYTSKQVRGLWKVVMKEK